MSRDRGRAAKTQAIPGKRTPSPAMHPTIPPPPSFRNAKVPARPRLPTSDFIPRRASVHFELGMGRS